MLFTKLTEPEAKAYIGRRKDQGFTALQVMLTGFLGMTNLDGELPYAGTPPEHNFPRPTKISLRMWASSIGRRLSAACFVLTAQHADARAGIEEERGVAKPAGHRGPAGVSAPSHHPSAGGEGAASVGIAGGLSVCDQLVSLSRGGPSPNASPGIDGWSCLCRWTDR